MTTNSPTDPAPTNPAPAPPPAVFAHELAPEPGGYSFGPAAPMDDVARYHLARAQGFVVGMHEHHRSGGDEHEVQAWGAYLRMGVVELHVALLLAELQSGTPAEVAASRVTRWIEEGGDATEWLWQHGERLGLDLSRVRAYPLAAAIGRVAEDSLVEYRRARELAAKHPHRVTPTLDGDRVAWSFSCTASDDASCRAEWTCGCEQIADLQRTPDGTAWQHRDPWADEDDSPDAIHVQTGTSAPGDCNVTRWLGEDSMAEELYEGRDGVAVHPGPITTTWEGDYYSWQYADEPKAARS